jgi:hypothetical protein
VLVHTCCCWCCNRVTGVQSWSRSLLAIRVRVHHAVKAAHHTSSSVSLQHSDQQLLRSQTAQCLPAPSVLTAYSKGFLAHRCSQGRMWQTLCCLAAQQLLPMLQWHTNAAKDAD